MDRYYLRNGLRVLPVVCSNAEKHGNGECSVCKMPEIVHQFIQKFGAAHAFLKTRSQTWDERWKERAAHESETNENDHHFLELAARRRGLLAEGWYHPGLEEEYDSAYGNCDRSWYQCCGQQISHSQWTHPECMRQRLVPARPCTQKERIAETQVESLLQELSEIEEQMEETMLHLRSFGAYPVLLHSVQLLPLWTIWARLQKLRQLCGLDLRPLHFFQL
ncbi:unnamed protein product [Durusdinium trenchii]|uniref:Uncharacterized protein n=2 Tax=Durusdinium trenchii TaxID=1381693 RepID=A0ABP0T1J6_9DINO